MFAILMYSLNFSDEVGALVFDFGSMTTRVGFAGEDCPKVRISFLYFLETMEHFSQECLIFNGKAKQHRKVKETISRSFHCFSG